MASVEIVDEAACARFLARVLRDVTIGPSPTWLANRITQAGMRPISNVVDVSNYVMLELGHPNHAYDLDTVAGGRLRVRFAQEGERLVTLDDVERSFLATDVLICDGEDTPIGVAGVMGGASTEISDATTNVLLEAAWWHPMQIARTSTRLNLRSEASRRFERGTDIWGLDLAVERFCSLLAESGAVAAPDVIDERGAVPEHPPIRVRTDRVNLVTGLDLDAPTVRGLLEPIGFTVGDEADGGPGRRGAQLPSRRRRGDRRHRGGGPPPRLRQAPPDRPPLAPHRSADRPPAGAASHPGHPRRPRTGRGPAHAVPGPRGPGALRPGRPRPSR